MLIVEDLHWAQPAALELLRFVVGETQETRVLVIGNYRTVDVAAPHPLLELLGALPYQPQVQRVELEGLSEDEIGALIEALGYEPSPDLVARRKKGTVVMKPGLRPRGMKIGREMGYGSGAGCGGAGGRCNLGARSPRDSLTRMPVGTQDCRPSYNGST